MAIRLINCSVVVVGENHNPSILNPDFLARTRVVPDGWGWQVEEAISTPPISQVRYANDIAITCEPNKLQFVDASENVDPASTKIGVMAMQYIETLPHVRYTAIGLNFSATFPTDEPDRYLIDRFLNLGRCDLPGQPLRTVGLNLIYMFSDVRLRLALESGQSRINVSAGEQVQPVIIVQGNFHHNLPKDEDLMSPMRRIIAQFSERWRMFHSSVDIVLQSGG